MKYSYEYKRMCVELYKQGKWPDTPEGVKKTTFQDKIRMWARMEAACGSAAALREQRQAASKLYNPYRNLYLDKCYGESKTLLGEWMYFPTDEED